MKNIFKNKLYKVLKKDNRLWGEEKKELNETLLKDLIDKLDEKFIELLFKDKEMKEKFLQQITDKYGNGDLLKAESKNYKLIGLPLFNKNKEHDFEEIFAKKLLN